MYLSKALHYQFLWPHSYLNCFDQPICQLFAMTARLASQESCQTQLAAQGLSVLTQCWILQLQLLALLNEVWSCRLFSQYIAPSVTSSPVFLYCENRSLVSSVFIDHTLLFDDAVPWSDLSLLVLLSSKPILLHVSLQCCQLSSLLPQKHSGNDLNADNSHPRCSIYLLAPSYKGKQYFTASRIRNDSWNYRLVAIHPHEIQGNKKNPETISYSCSLFTGIYMPEYWFGKCRNNFLFVGLDLRGCQCLLIYNVVVLTDLGWDNPWNLSNILREASPL